MHFEIWSELHDDLCSLHNTSIWEPNHEPMVCEQYMGDRVRRFWFRLAHAVRPCGTKRAFPSLEPTPFWVAKYELQCLERWLEHVMERYDTGSSVTQAWFRGLDACKTLMNAYKDWKGGFVPPSDWESEFSDLVEDLFDTKQLTSTCNRPTMIRFWFEEIVRYWVSFRWDMGAMHVEDLNQKHKRDWKKELQTVQEWIERQLMHFECPDFCTIHQTRMSLELWTKACDNLSNLR